MSEVAKVVEVGKLALRKDGATALTVARALAGDVEYDKPKTPEPPAVVTMTDELRSALKLLPTVFGKTQVEGIRQLTEAERMALGVEQDVIGAIKDALDTREAAIKESVRNHMDLDAVAKGLVTKTTEVDQHGHYVVASKGNPERLPIPGTGKEWSREYRAGSVTIDGNKIHQMYEDGTIDRKTWLSMTREVRVFDEDRALAAMEKDPGLLETFRKLVKRGRPVISLYVRKAKNGK